MTLKQFCIQRLNGKKKLVIKIKLIKESQQTTGNKENKPNGNSRNEKYNN